ncbi:hypothetical protein BV25DRAFT_1918540 [Artomyces pyxidatus]|uniref:Uncharacterized protein n=1 Tax=Artomyces pyxidatus TaxID=48021 RepID=A0ACB8STU9_9AGAM|nr:hypothetical protein BV25DRAFT_1918540 [Artomyces pyxidatus]
MARLEATAWAASRVPPAYRLRCSPPPSRGALLRPSALACALLGSPTRRVFAMTLLAITRAGRPSAAWGAVART